MPNCADGSAIGTKITTKKKGADGALFFTNYSNRSHHLGNGPFKFRQTFLDVRFRNNQ